MSNIPMSPVDKKLFPYLLSLGIVILISCMGLLIHQHLEPVNLVMLYLLGVVISASLWGRGPAIMTSLVGVLVFDILFVPPRFNITVYDTQYILTFAGLFIVGIMISELASKLRQRAIEANTREEQTSVLYKLSRDLLGTLNLDDVLKIIQEHFEKIAPCDLEVLLQISNDLKLWRNGEWAYEEQLDRLVDLEINEGAFSGSPKSTHVSSGNFHRVFLKMGNRTMGVLYYRIKDSHEEVSSESIVLMEAMAHQSAIAIERIRLLEENRKMDLMREKEKLHTALLNSITHDLRTPLVSITGSLSSLMEDGDHMEQATARELIETAYEESIRLNTIVGALLDMTRIEAGALSLNRHPSDIGDLISISLNQVRARLGNRPITLDIPPDLPDVSLDMPLMVKAIVYVLDNAIKYSASDAPIIISARKADAGVIVSIRDKGIGIPAAEMNQIFQKFFRGSKTQREPGVGLGLSICKGIVEAHKGIIRIESAVDQGTSVMITLPEMA